MPFAGTENFSVNPGNEQRHVKAGVKRAHRAVEALFALSRLPPALGRIVPTTRPRFAPNIEQPTTTTNRLRWYPANLEPSKGSVSKFLMLHRLRNASGAVLKAIKRAHRTRANINTIFPPELLALVFSFPVNDAVHAISFNPPEGPDEAEVQRRFGRHPLWNASLVCRAWYAIIKDTPSFWTFVAVGFTFPEKPSPSAFDHPAAATSRSPHRKKRLTGIEILLERSGRLPLTVMLCPENIHDLPSISHALHKHFDRLEILGLVASDNLEPRPWGRYPTSRITLDQARNLLANPIPKLKLLSISRYRKRIMSSIWGPEIWRSIQDQVDAPELETISCHFHLITPSSPTRLSSLSLIAINLEQRVVRPVELPHLVNLRIENSRIGIILSILGTPSLQRLVVEDCSAYDAPAQLRRYDSLQELQWSDSSKGPLFVMLCRLCPNLKRYLNYVEKDSIEKDVERVYTNFPAQTQQPLILTVFDENVLENANAYRYWPLLEEVSLDRATCDHVVTLIRAVPSIKRVRLLRDPVPSWNFNYREAHREMLAVLRGQVEVAIRDEPWESGSRTNETPREVAVTL